MKDLIYVVLSFLTLIFAAKCEQVGSCARGFAGDESESFASGANDIIVVEQDDGTLKSTILNVQVCKSYHWKKFELPFSKVTHNLIHIMTALNEVCTIEIYCCHDFKWHRRPKNGNAFNWRMGLVLIKTFLWIMYNHCFLSQKPKW